MHRYREVSDATFVVFLVTGAILTFDRLASGAGPLYAIVLGVKVLAAVVAYQYAVSWRHARLSTHVRAPYLVLIFGAICVLLAAVLKGVFESGLRSAL